MNDSNDNSLEQLIDELSRVFWEPEPAKELVQRVGFPSQDIPIFSTARSFWARVAREIRNGKVPFGLKVVAGEAALRYPGNTVFTAWVGNNQVPSGVITQTRWYSNLHPDNDELRVVTDGRVVSVGRGDIV